MGAPNGGAAPAPSPARLLLTIAGLEFGTALAVSMLWVTLLDFSDARLFAPLLVVRAGICLAHFHVQLAPIREFAQARAAGREIDDRQLREADAALQRIPTRQFAVVGLSWVAVTLLSLLPAAGLVFDQPLGRAELLVAGMMICVIATGSPLAMTDTIRAGLQPLLLDVGRMLAARKLEHLRRRGSIAAELTRRSMSSTALLLIVGCAVAALFRVEGIRAGELGEQRRIAQTTAMQPDAPLPSGVSIVDASQLPPILTAEPDATSDEIRSRFDPVHERVIAAAPIGDGRWALAEAHPDEQLGLTLLFIVAFLAIALTTSGVNGLAGGRAVSTPIEELDAAAREVIEVGRLDEIRRITSPRNDELGALASTFNRMLDTFDELAHAAKAVGEGDLRVELDRPGDLPDAFRAMLERLHDVVVHIRETTLELASAASELLASTEAQSSLAAQQAAGVQQVTQTTDSLASSASQITQAAAAVRDNAEQTLTTTAVTLEMIQALDAQSRGIRELLELIHEIADRSDLLALNGSLEAVRAGEAGRGFALVAAEMRRLAERVGGTVNDIRTRVASIEASASSTVDSTERSRALAESTARAAREINDAIVAQSHKTEDAAVVARQVAGAVRSFEDAAAQTRSTAEGLRIHAEQLEKLTGQFQL